MQKKRAIGIDLDNVLLDFTATFLNYHNAVFNTNFRREDMFNYQLGEPLGCSEEEAEKRILDFYETDFHWNAFPVGGAPEAIKQLSKNNSLVVVTSKPQRLKEKTLVWISKHYGDVFSEIFFTNQFHGDGAKKTKGEVCGELGVSVFIDDHIECAEDVAREGIKVLLLNEPWNQKDLMPGITRVNSWEDILKELS